MIDKGKDYQRYTYFEFANTGYSSPCWIWRGHLTNGYARIRINKNEWKNAHVITYEFYFGKSNILHHLCRRKDCCNPFHLENGDSANNRRKDAKLTIADVKKIRLCLAVGFNQHLIAEQFAVCNTTICEINRGRNWRNNV